MALFYEFLPFHSLQVQPQNKDKAFKLTLELVSVRCPTSFVHQMTRLYMNSHIVGYSLVKNEITRCVGFLDAGTSADKAKHFCQEQCMGIRAAF